LLQARINQDTFTRQTFPQPFAMTDIQVLWVMSIGKCRRWGRFAASVLGGSTPNTAYQCFGCGNR